MVERAATMEAATDTLIHLALLSFPLYPPFLANM